MKKKRRRLKVPPVSNFMWWSRMNGGAGGKVLTLEQGRPQEEGGLSSFGYMVSWEEGCAGWEKSLS